MEFLSPRGRNLNWGMAWTSWPFRATNRAAVWMMEEGGMVRSNETGQESLVLLQERDTVGAAESTSRECWEWSTDWRKRLWIESVESET